MGEVFDTNWKRYGAAIIATLVVFGFGVGLGYAFASQTARRVRNMQEDLEEQLLGMEVQESLAEEYICEADIFGVSEERTSLGRRLTRMENSFGPEDERVKDMKKRYSLLSIRQMLVVEEYNELCNDSYAPIIFFYSNKKNVTDSESQGYVLDYIYETYPDEVVIYSLDFDLDEPGLNALKDVYNVNSTPTIVVNETKYEGLRDRDEVEEILTEETYLDLKEEEVEPESSNETESLNETSEPENQTSENTEN
ncbi:MAG: DsbA family protein [Candidatus Aenigmatarchaeota archaeon]